MPKTIAQLQADLRANLDSLVAALAEQYGFEAPADISPNMRQVFASEAEEGSSGVSGQRGCRRGPDAAYRGPEAAPR
jgi:hypothetical protein